MQFLFQPKVTQSSNFLISALFLAVATSWFPSLSDAKTIERVYAVINDDIITLSDIDQFEQRLKIGGLVDRVTGTYSSDAGLP